MVCSANALERPAPVAISATATMGNSKPLLACTVIMRTKSPPSAESAPGASLARSMCAAKRDAQSAGPRAPCASKPSTRRMALNTLPATERPSASLRSRRVSQPESRTAFIIMRDVGCTPACSESALITRTAQASCGETFDISPSASCLKPISRPRRRLMPAASSKHVDRATKSSAESSNMSLASNSKSDAVALGLAMTSASRCTTRTSGAREKIEPPAITHAKPASRSAAA